MSLKSFKTELPDFYANANQFDNINEALFSHQKSKSIGIQISTLMFSASVMCLYGGVIAYEAYGYHQLSEGGADTSFSNVTLKLSELLTWCLFAAVLVTSVNKLRSQDLQLSTEKVQ